MLARKHWRRPEPLVAKAATRRKDERGPARNDAWLAQVRRCPCLICPDGYQRQPTIAHHPKGLLPRTLGVRVSDLTVLPLCWDHHTDGPNALHRTGDELGWWKRQGIEPYGVILAMLAQCRDSRRQEAIDFVKLHRDRARQPGEIDVQLEALDGREHREFPR